MANFSGVQQKTATELYASDFSKTASAKTYREGVDGDGFTTVDGENFLTLKGLANYATGDPTEVVAVRESFPQNNYDGIDGNFNSTGFDWFERVHILPRTKIQFGNILTLAEEEYELFSAYRTQTITMTGVGNNLGDGSSLPDLPSTPADLAPFTSFTDPASTRLSYDRLALQVVADGTPTFDDSVIFTFDTGETPFLLASGNRISMITPVYETNIQERWTFRTDIIETVDGKEQRIGLLSKPRQALIANYLVSDNDRQRMQAILHGWQTKLFAVPVWHEQRRSTAAVAINDTTVATNTTDNFDFRVGGLAVIFEDATKFDVLILSAVNTNSLEFTSSPVQNAYSANAVVLPIRLAWITDVVRGSRYRNKLENFQITFRVYDNDTGMFAADNIGFTVEDIDGTDRVVFDDCNVMNTPQMSESYRQKLTVIDNQTGNIEVDSRWNNNKRSSFKGFSAHNQAQIRSLKQALLWINGRQKAFWLPVAAEDLTASRDLNVGENTFYIDHIEFTRFIGSSDQNNPKKTIRINFTDGTYLNRQITGASEVDDDEELLTLDDTWPATRTTDEIDYIEFLELSRFDSDVFIFRFPKISTSLMTAPVVTVFDENV